METNIFIRKIKNILVDNKVDRYERNKKKGKLDTRRLYKKDTNLKVFKQKVVRSNKDYYVTLYLDCSISMEAHIKHKDYSFPIPRYYAMGLMVDELQETLSKIDGIKTRIIFYSSDILLFKDYSKGVKKTTGELLKVFKGRIGYYQTFLENNKIIHKNNKDKELLEYMKNPKDNDTVYLRSRLKKGRYIFNKKINPKKVDLVDRGIFEPCQTPIISLLKNLPPENYNEISFLLSDGDFNDRERGENYIQTIRNLIKGLRGDLYGIGVYDSSIIQYLGFKSSVAVYSMTDLYSLIVAKISGSIRKV